MRLQAIPTIRIIGQVYTHKGLLLAMKNVLVTGASGFLGKRLIERQLSLKSQYSLFYPSIEELDLTDLYSVDTYFKENTFDIVIHLAAMHGGVGNADKKALEYLEDNLLINYNTVHNSIKHNVKYFIMIGSSSCYNNQAPIPTTEDSLWHGRPESSYGVCKLVMLEHLLAQNIMDWVCLIPPNYYGPGCDVDGESAHLIPATIKKFENAKVHGIPFIDVWGDGSQIRDFLYIDDMVSILCNVLERNKYSKQILNVSTNTGTSIKEAVTAIRSLLELNNIEIRWDTSKPTGTHKKILSNERLMQIDNSIRITPFQDGIKKTIDWYKERK